MILLDFETRSLSDLPRVGAWRYSIDPTTSITVLGFQIPGGEYIVTSPFLNKEAFIDSLNLLKNQLDKYQKIVSFNVFFERSIWNNVLCRDYPFLPKLKISQTECLAAKAMCNGLPPSLSECLKALGYSHTKDSEGSRMMLKTCRPLSKDPLVWLEDKASMGVLADYCKQDLFVEGILLKDIGILEGVENEIWKVDQIINKNGLYVDLETVENMKSIANFSKAGYLYKFRELTNNEVSSPNQTTEFNSWLAKNGVHLYDLKSETVSRYLYKNPHLPINLALILKIRLYMSKTSVSKFDTISKGVDDCRLLGSLVYCGTSTGRWSAKRVQPHNFPRYKEPKMGLDAFLGIVNDTDLSHLDKYKSLKKRNGVEPILSISEVLRSVVTAPTDRALIISDYSTIEPRVLFWLCGEEAGLSDFNNGVDIYKNMAARIFEKDVVDVSDEERQVGKEAVLGCGYGMGHKRFHIQCESKNISITEQESLKAVNAYRSKYKKVVGFWKDSDMAFNKLISNIDRQVCSNKIRFIKSKNNIKCYLPSDRPLAYYNPSIDPTTQKLTYKGVHKKQKNWVTLESYGAKLVENFVQATARDILAHAMVNLTKSRYKIVFTVHDEVVCEINTPENEELAIKKFNDIMTCGPKWSDGIPLKCETVISKRYIK